MKTVAAASSAWRNYLPGTAVIVLALGFLAGCSDSDYVPAVEEPLAKQEIQVESPSAGFEVPEGVDPVRIVLAFVLLSSGDIEAAMTEGLVSPDEVAIAITALDDGTIQDWIDIAEERVSQDAD